MSSLLVRVFATDKAIETEGEVAFGEQVAVAVEFKDTTVADASSMRLRVRYRNADVAVFPLVLPDPENDTEGDAWEEDAAAPAGTRWTATLNLNTVQLRAAFGARPWDNASVGALLMLDCYDADNAALHALGKIRIRWWNMNETITGIDRLPAPVDIGAWATAIGDRLSGAEADIAEHGQHLDELDDDLEDHEGDDTRHFTTSDRDKFFGIEAGAQVNVKPDWNAASGTAAEILNKPVVDTEIDAQSGNAIANSAVAAFKADYLENKSAVETALAGKAPLDGSGKVPAANLPSYVDDVQEYANLASFPATGESGKIYVALDTNKTYRWGGSAFTEISESLALGETESTAFAGNRGKNLETRATTLEGRGYIQISNGHIQAVIPE